jgi:hypothetical protein
MPKKTEETKKPRFPKPTGRIGKKMELVENPPALDGEPKRLTKLEPAGDPLLEKADEQREMIRERLKDPDAYDRKIEETVQVLEPVDNRFIKISLRDKNVHIDVQGIQGFDMLHVMRGAYKYLVVQLQKEVERLNGIEEAGATDTVSGSDT